MATLTISLTPAQSARIAKAYGNKLSLGRDATQQEIEAHIFAEVKQVVKHRERREKEKAIKVDPFNPS